tara:strand:+ start:1378 stop:2103 length:726 start_codon:yes stop_codon:yes gene_type:complete
MQVQFESAAQYATHLINVDGQTIITKKNAMAGAVERFGEAALTSKKLGGINTLAFKPNAKVESREAEAKRIGLTVEEATELVEMIRLVNEDRKTLWQDYQCAHFGRDVIKPKPVPAEKSPEEVARLSELANIADERAEIAQRKKAVAQDLKIAKANKTIAEVAGADTSELDVEIKELEESRDECTRESKTLKADVDALTRGKRIESAIALACQLSTKLASLLDDGDDIMKPIIEDLRNLQL